MKDGKQGLKSFLVEVTPVSKAASPASLSYFSSVKIPVGTLVKIPLRKGYALGVSLRSRDVKTAKTEIRRAGFLLKKIRKNDIYAVSLPAAMLAALQKTAKFYATSVGALLSLLVPKLFSEDPEFFFAPAPVKKKKTLDPSRETLLLQMEAEERFGQYRALVRQAFARDASVIFVVPTHLEIERARAELSKGIAEFVYAFSLSSPKKDFKSAWQNACNNKHPVLIITTPACMLLPRSDIDTLILDRENSRSYRTLKEPFIHFRTLAENLAKSMDKQIVLGDSILSLETLMREKNGEFGENSLIRWRLPAAPTLLVDAKSKQDKSGHFEIFSPELKALMEKALGKSGPHSAPGRIFLFGARKGLAPTTVCGDCGYLLPCLNCGAPVVLHRQNEANIYICHACRARRESTTTCGYCGSWKLVPLGIGTAEIARQAHALFPKHPVAILDRDHASTDRAAKSIAKKFREEGGILVGTELAFFHLESVPYSALVSVDALFSVPDFGISERIFYLVNRLRELTKIEALVQTRNIGKQILAWAAQGNIIDFYQTEIEERRTLAYPPFSVFIKITSLKKGSLAPLQKLKEELGRYRPDIFKDSLIIRVEKRAWPDEELLERLSLLGPAFSIKVDLDSIL